MSTCQFCGIGMGAHDAACPDAPRPTPPEPTPKVGTPGQRSAAARWLMQQRRYAPLTWPFFDRRERYQYLIAQVYNRLSRGEVL